MIISWKFQENFVFLFDFADGANIGPGAYMNIGMRIGDIFDVRGVYMC